MYNLEKIKYLETRIPTNEVNNEFEDKLIDTRNIEHLTKGGNSEIFCGNLNLINLTIPLAIKAIKDSDEQILNEFKMHLECCGQSVIPFYGITKVPEKNKYAMVMRRAKYGDLRKYIKNSPELTWADRIEILINISKEFDIIQRVLPYIAPEVLKTEPYTKQSEVLA
ncbi:hypothetical protein RhiirA5_503264 [Rhizophagus irregularis]|uniref:Serine-threonine/tyrosine-protein kinase catalytic domain-containing protein n=1 Tax=Rhizophagus irregularis TaxID=588596 RepID=A0A2I1FJG3_9GLOM|nr:hypothetical protein RhiirA5_503264 [Rhizophagus irregularis]PKY34497.1 hypothetical protein RhiirB3_532838 [Rhizophagus irregularis]